MALRLKSIPVWFSFIIFFAISTLVFGFCFTYLFPIAEIPSDDSVYGANLVAVSNCFADAPKNNPLCIPGPSIYGYTNSVNFIKPTIGVLGGLTHAFLSPFYPFTGVDILSLLNFVSLATAVSLMCAVLANSKPFVSILTFLFIACSVTTHGTLIWTGYSFIVLLLLVLIFILHSSQDMLTLGRQIGISLLLALLLFVHIATLPWVIAYFSIFSFQSYRRTIQMGKVSYYPLIRILTVTVILILVVDRLGADYGLMSYIESYFTAYQLNVSSAKAISNVFSRNHILSFLTIPFYYFSVEPLLVMLIVISAVASKSTWTTFARDFSGRSTSLLSSPYGMTVGATLIAILIISVSPTEKLLRLFAPAHLGICLMLSFFISYIYLKGSNWLRIVISLCLLAFFQFSITENFYQYVQRAPIPRMLEEFKSPSSNVFSSRSDPLIYMLSNRSANYNRRTDDFPLAPFYPIVADKHKEHYLATKVFTNDYHRFQLRDDKKGAIADLAIGDFLLTSSMINDPGIGYVDSIKLIWDRLSSVNHWQSTFGSRRITESLVSGGIFVPYVHVIKHMLWKDLSIENSTFHVYHKCGSFEGYVNKYDDLLSAYNGNMQAKSKHEWGKSHYCTYGIKEGRTYSWLSEASCIAC